MKLDNHVVKKTRTKTHIITIRSTSYLRRFLKDTEVQKIKTSKRIRNTNHAAVGRIKANT